jgi:adenosylmethionine-8-amino-7-oxononanoate aminotransferase
MKDEQLPKRVRNMEGMFAEAFRSLNDLPSVATVRTGIGFLAGIEMVEPGANFPMMWTLRKHGIVTRPIVGNALQVSPALTTSEGEIHEMVKRFRAALY